MFYICRGEKERDYAPSVLKLKSKIDPDRVNDVMYVENVCVYGG